MGKLYLVMGKSATGKDHIYKSVCEKCGENLKPVVGYTTRPQRVSETQGVEYHFVTLEQMKDLETKGLVIESRCYNTVAGPWYYFTCDDGQIDTASHDSILIVTLEAYEKIRDYFGKDNVVPVYIETADGERLKRSIQREEKQEKPSYAEVCRRYLADEKDFSPELLERLEINRRFENNGDINDCVDEIVAVIRGGGFESVQ
ncbi:MAG: guanylate kinase [Lachnospiraceae bacterium]